MYGSVELKSDRAIPVGCERVAAYNGQQEHGWLAKGIVAACALDLSHASTCVLLLEHESPHDTVADDTTCSCYTAIPVVILQQNNGLVKCIVCSAGKRHNMKLLHRIGNHSHASGFVKHSDEISGGAEIS